MAKIRTLVSVGGRIAPFAGLIGCWLALPPAFAADASQPQTVTVTTVEYRFMPKTLRLQHGVQYQMRIVNRGNEQHEFTAPDFFKTLDIAGTGVLNADKTEIEIPPGTTKTLNFTAKQPGRYDLRCSDHDWAGMTGHIIVK